MHEATESSFSRTMNSRSVKRKLGPEGATAFAELPAKFRYLQNVECVNDLSGYANPAAELQRRVNRLQRFSQ